jgi:GTPase
LPGIIAIVGRPNVGKSTLFNRLTETRDAIVDETSGTTRDRHYGRGDWNGKDFSVIDTGGYVSNSEDVFESEINKQVQLAIEESDCIVFMVDVTTGVTSHDEAVAKLLRKSKKKIILVVNKVDNHQLMQDANEFYSLGFGEPFCISSMSGSGTGELLDKLTESFEIESKEEDNIPRIAIVGRPNVGKSSLINTLIGEERNIVTPVAGTTRDSVHTRYTKFNHDFILIDTAGLRKKAKVHNDVEFYSVMRSVRAIESANICLLLIDATEGIDQQDLSIFRLIVTNKKGCIILVNKWDLVEKKDNKTHDDYMKVVRERIAPFDDVPVLFISAITKQRVFNVLEMVQTVYQNMQKKISTSELNEFLQEAMAHYPPPSLNGKNVNIKYGTQLPTKVPSFALFANHPKYIGESYKRYLENQLREKFNFKGVPINIFFRQK